MSLTVKKANTSLEWDSKINMAIWLFKIVLKNILNALNSVFQYKTQFKMWL